MKKTRKYGTAKSSPPIPKANGTAVLGRVIPELVVCGVFDVSDSDASFIAKGISTSILSRFSIELLEHAGLLGNDHEN